MKINFIDDEMCLIPYIRCGVSDYEEKEECFFAKSNFR